MSTTKKPIKKPAAPSRKVGAATAASILGGPVTKPTAGATKRVIDKNGQPKIKPEWKGYYSTLLDLRERLLNQMNGLAKESAEEMASYSLHMADSGTDNFDRDFALSWLSSCQDRSYGIKNSL